MARLSLCGLAWLALISEAAWAANQPKNKTAENLVNEALRAEIYGLGEERAQLLQEAQQCAPDYAPAQWQAGRVKYHNEWLTTPETASRAQTNAPLNEYRKVRDGYANTVEGQISLANWCQRKGLAEQERAHLTRALDLNPEYGEARQRLGFRKVEGVWMTEAEIKQGQARGAAAAKALATWTPKLEEIRSLIEPQKTEAQRTTGMSRLRGITDPAAVPALEAVFSNCDRGTVVAVIDVLDQIPGDEATMALARQAVYSRHEAGRMAAVVKLKGKPADVYVPALLALMHTPVQSRSEIFAGPGGRLMYRQAFLREGKDNKELLVLDVAFRRDSLPNGDGQETLQRTLAGINMMQTGRTQQVSQQNTDVDTLNDRVCGVLAVTQNVSISPSPDAWWQWWNDTNEVYVSGEKPVAQRYQSQQITVQDRVSLVTASGGGSPSTPSLRTMDCFVAGTPVWTIQGIESIEKIKVGDLVLSQNVDTGELTYKPVVRTTIRPASKLVKATIGAEALEMSGGHLLWTAGDGWTKARNLKSGCELHALGGTVRASLVENGRTAETHNLVVADFNTYFAGASKVLSHDNTIKRRTTAIVPGLKAD